MREWSLRAGDPMSLTLCADARFGVPDYANDQIWQLSLLGGEPPGLSLRTTYGLRARSMRLFYRFTEAGRSVTDPVLFHQPVRIRRFYPNFLALDFVPVEGIHVAAEFWVPESHVIAGRLTFTNQTTFPRHLDLELCAMLSPLEGRAFGMAKTQQMVRVLGASTGGLYPIVFMSGGPTTGSGPHPSLGIGLDFEAGVSRGISWACAAEASEQASFELARRTAGRNWDAERARIQLLNAQHVIDIYTGDPDWDAALAFSQKAALGTMFTGGEHLPMPSFVRVRGTDNGFSPRGDGSDHPVSWSGQAPMDAYFLAGLLPGWPQLRAGLLENFLSVQASDGTIDARPGLAGQRTRFNATPLLARMAWDHFQESRDRQFLTEAFPGLLDFFRSWFDDRRDRDGDGIPAWEHVLQTGLDENPFFDSWYPWSQALEIGGLFNPELEALLLSEADALAAMADALDLEAESAEVRRHRLRLQTALNASWDERQARFSYRDRRTGASWTGRLVGSRKGAGEIVPRRPECDQPVRLLIQVHSKSAAAARPSVEIYGRSQPASRPGGNGKNAAEGRATEDGPQSERIAEQQFQWRSGGLVATSQMVYGRVERVLVEGLNDKDRFVVRTVDTAAEDITLCTPLWAHALEAPGAQAMAERLLEDESGLGRAFGIAALAASPSSARKGTREQTEAEAMAMSVHMAWNSMVGEGLLAYGLRPHAAQLTTRLMRAVIHCLRQNAAFNERYHALTGEGLGERDALSGFAPVGLFLKTLGVTFLSATSIRLEGTNPFPWPVTLVFRGTKVVRGLASTEVTFPGAKPVNIREPGPCVVNARND